METTSTTATTKSLYSQNKDGNIVLGVIVTVVAVHTAILLLGWLGSTIDSTLNPNDDWTGFTGAVLGLGAGALLSAAAMIGLAAIRGSRTDVIVAISSTLIAIPLWWFTADFGF